MNAANEHDDVLGYLASLPDAEPPAGLWPRVRAAVRDVRGGTGPLPARRYTWRDRRRGMAAAASLVLLAGLAGGYYLMPETPTAAQPASARQIVADEQASGPADPLRAEIRALDRRLQGRLADDAPEEEIRRLWRERAVLAERLDRPDTIYRPVRI